ncbi:secreted protein [Phlyctema vagabunda]|uniref:Secreted protein n=1 Tax=Phlyctema vagabunda TaxID=108571 RepID=A0ABR4P7J4_9HELO
MRSILFLAALPIHWAAAFSFNAYDLGFHGVYPRQHFQSVDYEPPKPVITEWDSRCDSGSLFVTPRGPSVSGAARGPVILDPKGDLIWMDIKKYAQAMNFNVQRYKGQDYLTFWTKSKKKKHKKGKGKHSKKSFVMLDSSYKVAYKIYPHGKGLKGDSHEFRITPQGTALIAIYHKRQADCTDLRLGKSCWIQDGIFQEIDIETGNLLFEWRATDHISMKDVYSKPSRKDGYGTSKKDAFDFFHINSVDKIESGDYIISARYMHAVVCVSGKTGEVLWQLGGKKNGFQDLNGATDFAWQHHVTWHGNNTMTLFDNHANNVFHSPSSHSKGMMINLDLEKMTASLLHKYVHPDKILNVSQGSVQLVPESGNVLVGFGNSPTYVEYTPEGEVLCSAHFAPHLMFEIIDFGLVKSYRVFKSRWVGKPKTVPDVKVKNEKIYASWNGATEVTGWRLESAKVPNPKDDDFMTIRELKRDGFETSFALDKAHKFVRVAALDAAKEVMAYSAVVKSQSPSSIWSVLGFLFAIVFFILSFTGFVFAYRKHYRLPLAFPRLPSLPGRLRRFPRLPRLTKLSSLGGRSYTPARGQEDFDPEAEPLLLD